MDNIYTWATASLGNSSSTLNDFVSPVGILVAAITSLILNSPSTGKAAIFHGLPYFLHDNVSIHSSPWANHTVNGPTSQDIPQTGITRFYDFSVARGIIAPDGVNKSSILVNDQYPGVNLSPYRSVVPQ